MTLAARGQRLSRRDAMRLLGAGTAGFVAACGSETASDQAAPGSTGETVVAPTAAASDQPIIRTILRDVAPDELGDGAILMHEHLSPTSPYPFEPPPQREVPPHFTGDVELITDEVRIAGTEGVACIVDGGHADMGRSLEALRRIAQGSGVHIVAAGGFYTQRAYPPDIASKTVEQMTEKRVAMVMRIVEAGHGDKLVLASDFYRRTELKAEGGSGYAKTVTEFAPMLREAGLDDATVQSFIADNPRRWLAFTPTA